MREIKFRAWNDQDKFWMYIEFKDAEDLWSDNGILCHNHLKYLNQYIGLKDACDKEIYEGDILSIDWPIGLKTENYIGQVDFAYGQFWCVKHNGYGGNGYNFDILCNKDTRNHLPIIKVIGDIYENPELLK
jgi:uncharacterized phage protein (TIGR01671 family)